MTRLHLRRIMPSMGNNPPLPLAERDKHRTLILLKGTTRFGRMENCNVLLTSGPPRKPRNINASSPELPPRTIKNLISRSHAEIFEQKDENGESFYVIADLSLNGTYLNDYRVTKRRTLNFNVRSYTRIAEGDMIKFGHMNGSTIKPGSYAPQVNAQFTFIVERANPNLNYLGFEKQNDGSLSDVRKQLSCWNGSSVITEAGEMHSMQAREEEEVSFEEEEVRADDNEDDEIIDVENSGQPNEVLVADQSQEQGMHPGHHQQPISQNMLMFQQLGQQMRQRAPPPTAAQPSTSRSSVSASPSTSTGVVAAAPVMPSLSSIQMLMLQDRTMQQATAQDRVLADAIMQHLQQQQQQQQQHQQVMELMKSFGYNGVLPAAQNLLPPPAAPPPQQQQQQQQAVQQPDVAANYGMPGPDLIKFLVQTNPTVMSNLISTYQQQQQQKLFQQHIDNMAVFQLQNPQPAPVQVQLPPVVASVAAAAPPATVATSVATAPPSAIVATQPVTLAATISAAATTTATTTQQKPSPVAAYTGLLMPVQTPPSLQNSPSSNNIIAVNNDSGSIIKNSDNIAAAASSVVSVNVPSTSTGPTSSSSSSSTGETPHPSDPVMNQIQGPSKTPPVECDSSVPSPPKQTKAPATPEVAIVPQPQPQTVEVAKTEVVIVEKPAHASTSSVDDDGKVPWTASPSPVADVAPSAATPPTARSSVDDELIDVGSVVENQKKEEEEVKQKEKKEKEEEEKTPLASPSESERGKRRKRTNELNNLLIGCSEVNKMKKGSSSVHRRPTEDRLVEKMAKKEKRKKEKAAAASSSSSSSQKAKTRLKQLSDEESASSDEDDDDEEEEVTTKPRSSSSSASANKTSSKKVVATVAKKRTRSALTQSQSRRRAVKVEEESEEEEEEEEEEEDDEENDEEEEEEEDRGRHRNRRKRATEVSKKSEKKSTTSHRRGKKGTLKRSKPDVEEDDDEEEEEVTVPKKRSSKRKTKEMLDSCGANDDCKIGVDADFVEWVQCDVCQQWWHTLCACGYNSTFRQAKFVCCGKNPTKSSHKTQKHR